ncbi:unnamed protein product [Caenorhabditis angaria]|uniref:PDZ domain-containing protein n=1 Tax=Caenorhabditis angaria TaxID=860376 RepID=A0A9P1IGD5_9PELO|nr:unnamed protein product [Caenorhabditis angaria]
MRIGDCILLAIDAAVKDFDSQQKIDICHRKNELFEKLDGAAQFVGFVCVRETTPMVLSGDWTQVEVIRLGTDQGGLGFGIVGGTSTGVVVKTILPGSPADKDGRLQPGDHILQIGSINTHGMSSQQVATILRHQHPQVEMIVGRPIAYADKPTDTADCFTLATKAALCAQTLDEAIQRQMATSAPSTAALPTPNTMSPSVSCAPIAEEPQAEKETEALPQAEEHVDLRKPCDCAPNYNRRDENNHVNGNTVPSDPPTVPQDTVATEELQTPSSQTSKISLKSLQEMALTVFLRENWQAQKFEEIDVELQRDPALGLGITVAGYVHKKEEIGGIFVKSLVPRSAASLSGSIRVHDLILEVNSTSLEHMSHADSVRTLVKSGDQVKLRLVRFQSTSPQAQCLKMLQQQETETQVIDVKLSNPDLVREWKSKIGEDIEILHAVVKPDLQSTDGGLGISLEGTVDVLNGAQLCPHHYIESIRHNGPCARTGVLQAGDELLQVNHSPLYGESHVTVRQALTRAVHSGAPVTLIVGRRSQHLHVFEPTTLDKQLPLSFSFLAANQETWVKAKSEVDLTRTRAETTHLLHRVARKLRSKSLENFHGLAVWNCVPLVIYLNKDSRGLGFSIVDYKDPTHRDESVIVVQSLVPGGIAQADGRIVPGDRLLFVNNHDLSNSSLERAVAVLKAARMGPVRLGIAKPIPVDQSQFTAHTPLCSRSERLLARGRSPRGRRRYTSGTTSSQETVWIGSAEQYRKLHPQAYYPSRSPSTARSERSLADSEFSMTSWSPCSTRSVSPCGSPISLRGSWAYDVIFLPAHLERTVKLQKGPLPLGVVLDSEKDKGVNGCVVKSICGKKAVALDGRIQVGDFVTKINTESLRNATNSQARAILKRTNLVGTFCNVTYITSADAKTWKERFQKPAETSSPMINRLSPKVFPKFYRSPYLSGGARQDPEDDDVTEAPSIMTDSMSEVAKLKMIDDVENAPQGTSSTVPEEEAEEIRKRMGRLIDGTEIDCFVSDLIKEAIADAAIELSVVHKTADWTKISSSRSGSEKLEPKAEPKAEEEEEPLPPPPPTATVAPIFRDQLIRRDSEPPPATSSRHSQLHILSTEEEVSNTRIEISNDTPLNSVPPAISPGALKPLENSEEEEEEAEENAPRAQLTAPISDNLSEPAEVGLTSTSAASSEPKNLPISNNNSNMSKVTSRTPSTGSETLQNQARQLARSKYWGEARTVILHREPNKSFGISIVGGRVEVSQKGGLPGTGNTVCGIFIKSVMPNSPAGKSGQMNMGDRVISVNDVDLRDATHEQAVNAIKNAENPVRFVLQSLHTNPQNHIVNSASNSTVNSVRFETREEPVAPQQITTPLKPMMGSGPAQFVVPPTQDPPTTSSCDSASSPDGCQREDTVIRRKESASASASAAIRKQESVESRKSLRSVKKRDSLRKSPSNETVPLIVSDVSSSEIHEEAEAVIDEDLEEDQEKPSTSSAEKLSELGIHDDSAARVHPLRRNSAAGDDKPSHFFYTRAKIQARYGSLEDYSNPAIGELLMVACEKPEAGLGISLAGNRNREKQSVFVVLVKPACPLAIRVGDELLEINGRVLRGISHVTASAIVRECCDAHPHVEIVLFRRVDGAVNECAVPRGDSLKCGSGSGEIPNSEAEKSPEEQEEEEEEAEKEQEMAPPTAVETSEQISTGSSDGRKKSFSVERTAPIDNAKETMIEIDKDGKGLGLSIVGGADTVLGTVVIHEVYPDGAAAHDGRLKPGDQVLEVNGVSLRGVTHDQSIAYLRRTPPKVRLLIYRDVNLQLSLLDPTQIYNMFEIDLAKKAGRGLGISIVGRKNEPGVYVSEIVKGGAAESDGRLMPGDQILEVNGKDVSGCMQEDVAAILKTCTGKVHLKLGRWKITETANRVHAATEALAKSATTPRVGRRQQPPIITENNNTPSNNQETSPTSPPSTSRTATQTATQSNAEKDVPPPAPPMLPRPIITHTAPDGCDISQQESVGLSPVTEEPSSGTDFKSVQEEEEQPPKEASSLQSQPKTSTANNNNSLAIDIIHDLKEEGSDTMLVELKKAVDQQLGMGIGKRTRGILVTSLQPGSAAAEKLKVGDRIMAVNALPVTDQLSAVTFVKASGERLFLQIARPRTFQAS